MQMTFYPEDGERFLNAMDMLRKTSLKRVNLPEDQRLGITVTFRSGSPAAGTHSVRMHLDGKTFCWMGKHGECREPLENIEAVAVWRL